MALTREQIEKLLHVVSMSQDDQIDCDGCFEHISEFADAQLSGKPLPTALEAVKTHLESCACCADEYQALLDALHSLEPDE